MFDIGFTEILLIGVVALIVVGPERLPTLVRTTLRYVRQIKSGVTQIRDEVEREIQLDELKTDLDNSKKQLDHVLGKDELQESLTELKEEAESLREIAEDGYEYADKSFQPDTLTDAQIEADLEQLAGPKQLPDPEAEAETGIEEKTTQNRN